MWHSHLIICTTHCSLSLSSQPFLPRRLCPTQLYILALSIERLYVLLDAVAGFTLHSIFAPSTLLSFFNFCFISFSIFHPHIVIHSVSTFYFIKRPAWPCPLLLLVSFLSPVHFKIPSSTSFLFVFLFHFLFHFSVCVSSSTFVHSSFLYIAFRLIRNWSFYFLYFLQSLSRFLPYTTVSIPHYSHLHTIVIITNCLSLTTTHTHPLTSLLSFHIPPLSIRLTPVFSFSSISTLSTFFLLFFYTLFPYRHEQTQSHI